MSEEIKLDEIVYPGPNPEKVQLWAYKNEIRDIEAWFLAHDYYPNKIVTGEWEETDERWTTYLADRFVKRTRLDELNELI